MAFVANRVDVFFQGLAYEQVGGLSPGWFARQMIDAAGAALPYANAPVSD